MQCPDCAAREATPDRVRTGSWTPLSARWRSTALSVPSRSNRSKTSRTVLRACSSGSKTTSPDGRRT